MRKALASLALLLFSCQPASPPNVPPTVCDGGALDPMPPDWPAPDAGAGTACERACTVLDRLGCVEGRPTPRGEPCAVTCQNAVDFPGVRLPTAAVLKCYDVACVRRAGVTCLTR